MEGNEIGHSLDSSPVIVLTNIILVKNSDYLIELISGKTKPLYNYELNKNSIKINILFIFHLPPPLLIITHILHLFFYVK